MGVLPELSRAPGGRDPGTPSPGGDPAASPRLLRKPPSLLPRGQTPSPPPPDPSLDLDADPSRPLVALAQG